MRPSLKPLMVAALILFALGVSARNAAAQKVLLLTPDPPAIAGDVQAKLLGTGAFTQVDVMDVGQFLRPRCRR